MYKRQLTEKITPYITASGFGHFEYLSPAPQGSFDDYPDAGQWRARQHQDYLASKAKYGYTQDYLTVNCCGTDAAVIEKLNFFISAGRINIDKLNSGEEILIIAPAEYGLVQEKRSDGGTLSYTDYTLEPDTTYSAVYQNDMFQVCLLYTSRCV